MELNDLHPADDYSHRFFIWHEWIQVCATDAVSVRSNVIIDPGKWSSHDGKRVRLLRCFYVL